MHLYYVVCDELYHINVESNNLRLFFSQKDVHNYYYAIPVKWYRTCLTLIPYVSNHQTQTTLNCRSIYAGEDNFCKF